MGISGSGYSIIFIIFLLSETNQSASVGKSYGGCERVKVWCIEKKNTQNIALISASSESASLSEPFL